MKSFFRNAIAGTAMVMISLSGIQAAHALTNPSMSAFCANYSSQCRVDGTDRVSMTDDLLLTLQKINSHVNRSIRPVADRAGRDVWSLNPRSGDCEDFALSKRAALIRQGVAAGALRIAVTKTRRGEPHAILVVKTSRGDYVLDNLRERVMTVGSSGYRLQFISTQNPRIWTTAG